MNVINRAYFTSYLPLCNYWSERQKVVHLCNLFYVNDCNMGRGLDDQSLRKIRGGRNWGKDRMLSLKNIPGPAWLFHLNETDCILFLYHTVI